MTASSDNVSRIHKRYTLTTFTPTSPYVSIIASTSIVCAIVSISLICYFKTTDLLFVSIPLAVGTLIVTQFIDWKLLKTDYSKSLHMSAFGNLLWLVTILGGMLSVYIFSKPHQFPIYITEGMILFASFRIGIFTSVIGAKVKKAWAICLIQPLAIFLAFVPPSDWFQMLSDPRAIIYG
ncbi:MAG TPA: DUF2070 family protein, partial [Candidatus Bathyarchaeia archaeon]|nr:DUF2070 family protein [Candidatus Bathyarchaeia archaeon]